MKRQFLGKIMFVKIAISEMLALLCDVEFAMDRFTTQGIVSGNKGCVGVEGS
jgi:hypothetical protein